MQKLTEYIWHVLTNMPVSPETQAFAEDYGVVPMYVIGMVVAIPVALIYAFFDRRWHHVR